MTSRLAFAFVGLTLIAGCSEPPLVLDTSYCKHEANDDDCVVVKAPADASSYGQLVVKSRPSEPLPVRRAGRKKYSVYRGTAIVGSIVMTDDDSITVTLTDGTPYAKTLRR